MSYHRSSQGAGCRDTHRTPHQQHQQQGTFNDTRRLQPPRHIRARYGAAAELSQMIDDHLASWQASQAPIDRPTSKGTVIVDWDGSGDPMISYQKKATVVEEVLVPLISPPPAPPLNRGGSCSGKADSVKQGRMDPAAYMRKPLPSLPTDEQASCYTRASEQAKRNDSVARSSHHFTRHDSVVSEAQTPPRRHAQHAPASPSTNSPTHPQHAHCTTGDGFTAAYIPPRYSQTLDSHRRPYIKGYDESTQFKYDYDGHIFHAHRPPDSPPASPRSTHSDYYAIDVEKYDAQAELRVQDNEVLSLPAGQGRKRDSAFRFVEKVLWKLGGLGLMKKLRDEKGARKGETSWREAGVCNLKRKVSGLPAVVEQDFEVLEGKSEEATHRPRNNDDARVRKPRIILHNANLENDTSSKAPIEDTQQDYSEQVSTTRCLFCPFSSPTLATNLEHMSTHHSLFIPSPSALYSLDSLLSYLGVVVFEYHECLHCGQEKDTTDAVQTHMRDKGHCMIEMSDLLDFWDLEDFQDDSDDQRNPTTIRISDTEMLLPSGLVINSQHGRRDKTLSKLIKPRLAHSRHRASQQRLSKRAAAITYAEHQDHAIPAGSRSAQLAFRSNSNDRHLTTIPRTAQGLTGLSDQQIRTLQMVDKRMKSREENAKAKGRYAAQQQPVKAMYYKTENPVYQAG